MTLFAAQTDFTEAGELDLAEGRYRVGGKPIALAESASPSLPSARRATAGTIGLGGVRAEQRPLALY
jgi:hypothetical protein